MKKITMHVVLALSVIGSTGFLNATPSGRVSCFYGTPREKELALLSARETDRLQREYQVRRAEWDFEYKQGLAKARELVALRAAQAELKLQEQEESPPFDEKKAVEDCKRLIERFKQADKGRINGQSQGLEEIVSSFKALAEKLPAKVLRKDVWPSLGYESPNGGIISNVIIRLINR